MLRRDALRRRRRTTALSSAAAVEVAERDVHQLGEPAKARRDELAERHQVVLVVAVEAVGSAAVAPRCRPPSWCSPSSLVAERQADQRGRAPAARKRCEQRLPSSAGRARLRAAAGSTVSGADHQRRRGARQQLRARCQSSACGTWRAVELLVLRARCPAAALTAQRAARPGEVRRGSGAARAEHQRRAPSRSPAARPAGRTPQPAAADQRRRATPATRADAVDADPRRQRRRAARRPAHSRSRPTGKPVKSTPRASSASSQSAANSSASRERPAAAPAREQRPARRRGRATGRPPAPAPPAPPASAGRPP